jgi:hypothetical protein
VQVLATSCYECVVLMLAAYNHCANACCTCLHTLQQVDDVDELFTPRDNDADTTQ